MVSILAYWNYELPEGPTDKGAYHFFVCVPDTEPTVEKQWASLNRIIRQTNNLQLSGAKIIVEVNKRAQDWGTGVSGKEMPCEVRSFQITSVS